MIRSRFGWRWGWGGRGKGTRCLPPPQMCWGSLHPKCLVSALPKGLGDLPLTVAAAPTLLGRLWGKGVSEVMGWGTGPCVWGLGLQLPFRAFSGKENLGDPGVPWVKSIPASLAQKPHPGPVRPPVPPGCPLPVVFPLGSRGLTARCADTSSPTRPGCMGRVSMSWPSSAGSSQTPGPASLNGRQDPRGRHGNANAHQEGAFGAHQPTCRGLCPVLELMCVNKRDSTCVWA